MFTLVVVLQFFLFNNLNMGIYVNPLLYVAFIILLPMEIAHVFLLGLGLGLGVLMDATMGTGGINTIALLATSFSRPILLNITVGKEEVREGGVPTISRLGNVKFFKYVILITLLHCTIFFTIESLTWSAYYLTMIRIVLSGVVTVVLVYGFQLLFTLKRFKIR